MTDHDSGTADCTQGWEALRGDSLGWLLDPERPNLHWRVLVELVGRPVDSPAVRRARGGANACEPVATLLADLMPDGTWSTPVPFWAPYAGPGWRLVAAVQWGADPEDPRLHAASERILETMPGEGGVASDPGGEPDPVVTARLLQTAVVLGWTKHSRVQEWFAWLEATDHWRNHASACIAVLAAANGREVLRGLAIDGITGALAAGCDALDHLGHPDLHETDLAEIFAGLAGAGVEWRRDWLASFERLQGMQDERGRWATDQPEIAPWVTLKATSALLTYAVDARLPRVFPYPPAKLP
jgi:hypothetical protein